MPSAVELARQHWNETPLFLAPRERYEKHYPWLPEAAEFTQHRGQRVLEIGCGTGCDLLQFAENGTEAHGIDVSEGQLALARQRLGNRATLQPGDGRAIPYPDGHFDYVYSHGVLHHSDEPEKIAREILRVLKPGGRFNLHVYAKWSLTHLAYRILYPRHWKMRVENSHVPVHIELYTRQRFHELFPGIPLEFSRRPSRLIRVFGNSLGWYLIAKGRKPV